jgi:hypothetical protein
MLPRRKHGGHYSEILHVAACGSVCGKSFGNAVQSLARLGLTVESHNLLRAAERRLQPCSCALLNNSLVECSVAGFLSGRVLLLIYVLREIQLRSLFPAKTEQGLERSCALASAAPTAKSNFGTIRAALSNSAGFLYPPKFSSQLYVSHAHG